MNARFKHESHFRFVQYHWNTLIPIAFCVYSNSVPALAVYSIAGILLVNIVNIF